MYEVSKIVEAALRMNTEDGDTAGQCQRRMRYK